MIILNRHQFFQSALGLKRITDGVKSYLVMDIEDQQFPQLQEFERALSADRAAAFELFSALLDANKVPIFISPESLKIPLQILDTLELSCLAQAIVDDDRVTVKGMLDLKPELLLSQPNVNVTSQYTHQSFSINGNFLGLACRSRQIEMVKIITPYFDKLIANEKKTKEEIASIKLMKKEGLMEWAIYASNANGEICVPQLYQDLINQLSALFKAEIIADNNFNYEKLSDALEQGMEELYYRLVPDYKMEDVGKRGIFTKRNHLDIEVLLYAAYKAFGSFTISNTTWGQRNAFAIRVIGILQNFLSPETAKIFCNGLDDSVEKNKPISSQAEELKVLGGNAFYRYTVFSIRQGMGFGYYISRGYPLILADENVGRETKNLEKLFAEKNAVVRQFIVEESREQLTMGPRT